MTISAYRSYDFAVRFDYAKLARLTGLPNVERIVDPERLESLSRTARGMLTHIEPGSPLRYQVALSQYIEAVDAILEDPEAFL